MRMGGIKDDLFNGKRRKLKVAYTLTPNQALEEVQVDVQPDEVTIIPKAKQAPEQPASVPVQASVPADVPQTQSDAYKPRIRR